MEGTRTVGLVVGCLLSVAGAGLLLGGGVLVGAHATQRGDDGYYTTDLARLDSSGYAIRTEDIDLGADPGPPEWLLDRADVTVRLEIGRSDGGTVFVGIGPAGDVDAYLAGVAHHELDEIDGDTATYRQRDGTAAPAIPGEQGFWAATASGPGTQTLTWEPETGRWAVVVMNADGSPGVAVDATVAARAGFVLPVGVGLLVAGAVVATAGGLAVWLSVRETRGSSGPAAAGPPATGPTPTRSSPVGAEPVVVSSSIDPELSRWRWLVKWFLAIPHVVVLAFLWLAFVVVTVIAGVAIVLTGRYPRPLFDFNVGVLRWTWRVWVYAFTGGLTTDRYPPFTLDPVPGYPATLDVAYPARLSRGLVLVKWWLLAIPHHLVLGFVAGAGWAWDAGGRDGGGGATGGGLLGVLVLIAAVGLLVTGRYHRGLFDLVVGLNRWVFRVVAYAALMTDRYPPFRLDQGGGEPVPVAPPPPAPPAAPATAPPGGELVGAGSGIG